MVVGELSWLRGITMNSGFDYFLRWVCFLRDVFLSHTPSSSGHDPTLTSVLKSREWILCTPLCVLGGCAPRPGALSTSLPMIFFIYLKSEWLLTYNPIQMCLDGLWDSYILFHVIRLGSNLVSVSWVKWRRHSNLNCYLLNSTFFLFSITFYHCYYYSFIISIILRQHFSV